MACGMMGMARDERNTEEEGATNDLIGDRTGGR